MWPRTTSRRGLLTSVCSLSLVPLAGCSIEDPEVELVTEAQFELTETDLISGSPTYGDEWGYQSYQIDSHSAFLDLINEESWPEDVDWSQFDDAEFIEDSPEGSEFIVLSEAAQSAGDRIEYEESLINGGRLLLPVSITCSKEPATRLVYRIQRWRQTGGGFLHLAGGNHTCFDETDSSRSGDNSTE